MATCSLACMCAKHAVCKTKRLLVPVKHAVCKTKRFLESEKHAVCKKQRFLVSGKTCRVQNKKVLGLGTNMPCAKQNGSWSRKKHAVCKKQRFLVSKKTCCVQQQKRFGFKKLVIRPPKLISQNRDPHSAGISVNVGIPIWARLFISRTPTCGVGAGGPNLDQGVNE